MALIFPLDIPVTGDSVVDAENLTKQFGNEFAVRDLTFRVPQGKIIGLIGPSGCGKTTTVRLLTGIYRPTRGKVTVLGASPRDFTAKLRERMGYMPQHFVLYPDLSVLENMNFAASLYGMSWFGRNRRIKSLLDFVELFADRHKLARNISGGMQRRLALAATLVHNPSLVFLDEPTAGIDPILRRKFWDQFQELKQSGRTMLVTTQYVNEAAYCDLVGVMAEGRLLMLETPDHLRRAAFGGDVVDLRTERPLDFDVMDNIQKLPFVRRIAGYQGNNTRLVVDDASTAIPSLLNWLNQQKVRVASLEEFQPPFDDVFVMLVERAQQEMGIARTQDGEHTATALMGQAENDESNGNGNGGKR